MFSLLFNHISSLVSGKLEVERKGIDLNTTIRDEKIITSDSFAYECDKQVINDISFENYIENDNFERNVETGRNDLFSIDNSTLLVSKGRFQNKYVVLSKFATFKDAALHIKREGYLLTSNSKDIKYYRCCLHENCTSKRSIKSETDNWILSGAGNHSEGKDYKRIISQKTQDIIQNDPNSNVAVVKSNILSYLQQSIGYNEAVKKVKFVENSYISNKIQYRKRRRVNEPNTAKE